jgi:hypothetical protein
MDATHNHPVRVSASVLEGLGAVWLLGETNTRDMREVQAQAYIMGYPDTAWWIEYFPNLYDVGLTQGFVAEGPPSSE